MTYSVRAIQTKPVEMNELEFDAAFGAGSFLEVVNYHRTLRKLHWLRDEQAVIEAAVLDAALAGDAIQGSEKLKRLRVIRAEIGPPQRIH
jgi:hypothetical protein